MPSKKPKPKARLPAADSKAAFDLFEHAYRELALFVESAEGFQLALATHDSPRRRDEAIERLTKQAAERRVLVTLLDLSLTPRERGLLQRLEQHLQETTVPADHRHVVMVVGIEAALDYLAPEGEGVAILQNANAQRESFPNKCPVPVVLWLSPIATSELAKNAPDLWHWRVATFDFTGSPELRREFEQTLLSAPVTETDGLSHARKRERIAMLQDLVRQLEYSQTPNSPASKTRRANLLNQLGHAHAALGETQRALECYREAEGIWRGTLGDEHPNVAACANNIGDVLHAKGDLDGALACFRKAERIARAAFGDDHPNVVTCVNNIGYVLHAKGDLDGALARFRECERIVRAAFGDNNPYVAASVSNIGNVLHAKGDLDGALACYREAEGINRAGFGDEHPYVAIQVNNIGEVLRQKGHLDGALACFREAERIWRAAFGDEHPNVATCVNNIAMVLHAKGDLDGALACFREAERIDRAALGNEHPNVARDVNNIGSVLFETGDRDGARKLLCEAFRIRLTMLGPRAMDTLKSAKNLTSIGLDAIATAREIAGPEAAEQLRQALDAAGQ